MNIDRGHWSSTTTVGISWRHSNVLASETPHMLAYYSSFYGYLGAGLQYVFAATR
jgi:hypothetical protein